MITKPAVYKKVRRTTQVLVRAEVLCCDECRTELTRERDMGDLRMSIFFVDTSRAYETRLFCSWRCVFANIPTITTDYFVKLPFIDCGDFDQFLQAADAFRLKKKK